MGKSRYHLDPQMIERRIKAGRGQGTLSSYKPFLDVIDVPSMGLSTRINGWKTHRVQHLLSQLELHYFLVFEWDEAILDISEQYDLPQDATIAIAKELGIKHPYDPKVKHHRVMTTDFYLTVLENGRHVYKAISIKYEKDATKRNLDKFRIESRYWETQGVSAKMLTERDLPRTLAENVKLIHRYKSRDSLNLTGNEFSQIAAYLTQHIPANPEERWCVIATKCDCILHLPVGTSLNVIKHLIATRYFQIDMNQPIKFTNAIPLLNHPLTVRT